MNDVPKRFKAQGNDVIRFSPHGSVVVAKCYTPAWAIAIAELLNADDAK